MVNREKQVQSIDSEDALMMQRSINDFVANYHNAQPHVDVARLGSFFETLHAKPTRGSDYTELPISLSYDGTPVHIVKSDPSRSHQKTDNPILDSRTGDIYYVFVGDDKEMPFAQLADNSNQWGTFSTDGRFEKLSEANYVTIQKILRKADDEVSDFRRVHERKSLRRKHILVGTVSVVATLGFLGGVTELWVYRQTQYNNEKKALVDAFDAYWSDKQIPAAAFPAIDGQVHNVTVASNSNHLEDAPDFNPDSPSVDGPRKTTLKLSEGSCGVLHNVTMKDDESVAVVALPRPSSIPPIGYSANSSDDTITICGFEKGDNVDLVFQVLKKK